MNSRARGGALLLALIAAALPRAASAADTHESFNGVWRLHGAPIAQLKTDRGQAPPLRPAALSLYAARREQVDRGDHRFDPGARCKPLGHPRLLWELGWPFELQISERRILTGYTWNRLHRLTDVTATAPEAIGPTYLGTSTAQWRGPALVVRSGGYNEDTLLDASGLPHSSALMLTETYRLLAGGHQLEVHIHFEDAATFTRPWDAILRFDRVVDGRIREDVCELRLGLYQEGAIDSLLAPTR